MDALAVRSATYGFECRPEYVEEHARGAETIALHFSRPIGGLSVLIDTNPAVALSPDERYFAVWSLGWVIVVDLATGARFRLAPADERYYQTVEFTTDEVTVTVGQFGSRESDGTERLRAIELDALGREWVRQVGRWPTDNRVAEPANRIRMLLNYWQVLPAEHLATEFETHRRVLLGQAGLAVEEYLAIVDSFRPDRLRELTTYVAADLGDPRSGDLLADLLADDNEMVVFAAAMGLDGLAGGRFQVGGVIDGGWVDHEAVRKLAPELAAWWRSGGTGQV